MPQNRRVMYGGKLKPTARVNKIARRIKVKTPEDLAQLDKQGLIEFLRSDRPDKVAIWNMRFGGYSAEPVDLSDAYLPDVELPGIVLNYANLTKATLSRANLRGAQLHGAIMGEVFLDEAHLEKSDLYEAHLEKANLTLAHLEGANLCSTNLEGANLFQASLIGVLADGTNMQRATLVGAHLEDAYLAHANLENADLSLAHLNRAALRWAILVRANLKEACLDEANLKEAYLVGAHFRQAHLVGADLTEANLQGAELFEAHLDQAILRHANLEGTVLDGAVMIGVDLRQATLRDTSLTSVASLKEVRLYQTYFMGVLSLRYQQLLHNEDDPNSPSSVWDDTECRYSEAQDVYKSLKGYFEDAGDYAGANWAYGHEQSMAKLFFTPAWARSFYPKRKWENSKEKDEEGKTFWKPNTLEWLRLEASDKFAGFGLSITKPLIWLLVLIFGCSIIYLLGGMVTSMPGCGYADLAAAPRPGCAPTYRLIDNVLFSLGALTSTDVGTLRPYLSGVGLLMTVEILLGILLTGLLGFVLGNKLRNS